MKKASKTFLTAAGIGTAVCAAAVAVSAYNSRPMKTKRTVKRVRKTMGSVGGMLTAMSQMTN